MAQQKLGYGICRVTDGCNKETTICELFTDTIASPLAECGMIANPMSFVAAPLSGT